MSKEKVWVKNFSIERVGYQAAGPFFDFTIHNCQKILFGKDTPLYLTEYFAVFEGVDLKGGYFIEEELQNLIKDIIKIILEEPARVEKLHKETYEINEEYFEFSKKCLTIDLSKLSNQEMGKLYLELIDIQEKAHQHSITTTWFVDCEDAQFSKLLIEKTKEFVSKSGKDIDSAEAFSLLTTLPRNSLGLQEEAESLQVLKKIAENEEAKQIFLDLKDFSKIPEGINEDINKSIQQHYEKWRWTPFDYMGPAYNIDYYLSVWAGLLKEGIDIDKAIKEIQNRPADVEKQRKQLMDELGLDGSARRLYDISADIAFLKGWRKDYFFFGFYVLSHILREMAKRLNLSMNQLYLLTFREVGDIFLKGKEVDVSEINARMKFTLFYRLEGEELRIITGKEAKEQFDKFNIKEEKISADVNELHGTCACSGKAKGFVKIVNNTEDMAKMEQGDVMVSHTTYPSLVPAMKKASAIITEDGGITCHAAIVSRELKTPCITGIKAATRALKDGDEVEVNAGEGVVKKIT
jgi:phosphohistidine swiveling domain-containing protein